MKHKWILFAVVILLMAINFLNADFSALGQLKFSDLVPVLLITLVSVLIKTGVLAGLLVGSKKLWQWLHKK